MSGWVRTRWTSSRSAASWSSTTWNRAQVASTPAEAEIRVAQLGLGGRGHRAPGVGYDEDPLHVEEVDPEDQRLERRLGDPAARVAEDLGVPGLQPDQPERVDA